MPSVTQQNVYMRRRQKKTAVFDDDALSLQFQTFTFRSDLRMINYSTRRILAELPCYACMRVWERGKEGGGGYLNDTLEIVSRRNLCRS